jgi:hypothetical protein
MLVNRGRQDCEILAMAEHLTWPDYTVAQTKDELIKMIAGARAKGFAPDAPDDGDNSPDDEPAPDVEDVMDVPPKAGAKPLSLLSDTDIEEMPDPIWLIEKVLVQNSLAALYGPWGSFKSFIALDWALCLATGTDWCDRKVQRADVLYIVGEGVGGLKNRLAAWKQKHRVDGSIAGFRAIPMPVNLMDLAEARRLILSAQDEQVTNGFTPAVIICDTLARSMVGGDENSVKDMGAVINNADLIRRELGGITFLPIHHAGKDPDRGMRGSTGLPGAMDTVFRVTRNGMSVGLFCEKQKDGEDSWSLHLAAEKVILPLRPGTLKPRDSLVLVPGEASASTAGRPGRPKGDAGLGLAVLFDTVVAEGFQLPLGNGFPSTPMRGTTEMAWRREFYRRLSERSADAKKHAFSRMLKELRDAGLVGLCDTKVWSVKQDDPARPGHAG